MTPTPSHSAQLGDLGAHHLVLLGFERQELVHRVDPQRVALLVDFGIQHPDESIPHQDRVREESVHALRLGLELLEHVRELEDLFQAGAIEQHPVVRVEERDPAAVFFSSQRGDRFGVDAELPRAALHRGRLAGLPTGFH